MQPARLAFAALALLASTAMADAANRRAKPVQALTEDQIWTLAFERANANFSVGTLGVIRPLPMGAVEQYAREYRSGRLTPPPDSSIYARNRSERFPYFDYWFGR